MNGVLVCSGTSTTKNIGDYIQSIAQEQFWNHVDMYVEREALNSIDCDEQVNVIMNGWYMWTPQNFPPSPCINPLFVSIHINPKIEQAFFRPSVVDYLKQHEPIGARDKGTQRMLEKHGVKSYYSSCLTLTLGMNYKEEEKNDSIIFVDPYIFRKETPKLIAKSILKAIWHLIQHPLKAHRLACKIDYDMTRISNYSRWLDRHLCMASFYRTYSKVFADELLFGAEYVSHTVKNVRVTDDDKMQMARDLVKRYAKAKLVITSRIHAALPCLGVETPVIFIPSKGLDATRENAGRFDGLEEFFNIIRWSNNKLTIESPHIANQVKNGKIGTNIEVINPDAYVYYRDELAKKVESFTNNANK